MKKFQWGLFTLALAASLSLTACRDTKTLKENEQLKAQVADLQKQVGEMGNRVDEATKAEDDAMKQNAQLREEIIKLKGGHGKKKAGKSRKRRRQTSFKVNSTERLRLARS